MNKDPDNHPLSSLVAIHSASASSATSSSSSLPMPSTTGNLNTTLRPLQTMVQVSSPQTLSPSSASPSIQSQSDLEKILNQLVFIEADYSKKDLEILPADFEPQNGIWSSLLCPAEDQGSCGSCWSFASVSCLGDRINVLLGKPFLEKMLSPLIGTVCNDITALLLEDDPSKFETTLKPFAKSKETKQNQGCFGNSLISAAYYLKFFGVPRQGCFPYDVKNFNIFKITSTNYGLRNSYLNPGGTFTQFSSFAPQENQSASCSFLNPYSSRPFLYCSDNIRTDNFDIYGTPMTSFKVFLIYTIKNALQNPNLIKYEIFRWGPVCTSFLVYEDFYKFDPKKDGVYIHDPQYDTIVGGHAVEIVGWGLYEGKTPFWWIKNSWGTKYGFNGYFRFLRGKNQCEIENNILAYLPNFYIDYNHSETIQKLDQQLKDLHLFHNKNDIQDYIQLVLKLLYSVHPSGEIFTESMIRRSIQEYGFFNYDMLLATGFLNPNVPLSSGYYMFQALSMPGLNYLDIDPSWQHLYTDRLRSPGFLAGNIRENFEQPIYPIQESSGSGWNLWIAFILLLILSLLACAIIFWWKRNKSCT